jgi:hypothetical protein
MVSSPVAARFSLPVVIAVLVLVGGFVAIAWTVQWSTSGAAERISQATTAGAAAVGVPDVDQNSNSLPAFTLDLDGVTAYQPQPVAQEWADPKSLDRMGSGVGLYAWMDAWFMCAFITDDYEYKPVGSGADPRNPQDALDMARWNELTFRQQQQVKGECDR